MFAALSLAIGLGTAWRAIENGVAGVVQTAGPWVVWFREGTSSADPYTQARVARLGLLPVTSTGNLVYSASADSKGRTLSGDCSYEIRGKPFSALWWSIAAYTPEGSIMDNAGRRASFNSGNIVTASDGKFLVRLAPDVQPGNWLLSSRGTPIVLRIEILRPLNTDALLQAGSDAFPSIVRKACS